MEVVLREYVQPLIPTEMYITLLFLMRQKEFFQICQAKTMKNIYHPFELFWITVEQQLS